MRSVIAWWRARLPAGRRTAIALPAVLVAALVVPVLVFAEYSRRSIEADIAERNASERVEAAELAARLLGDGLLYAGSVLELEAGQAQLQDALRRRDAALLERMLEQVRRLSPRFTSAAAFDTRGVLLARSPSSPEVVGVDFSHRDYFAGGMASSSWFASEAYRSAAPPFHTFVAISVAVRDGSETVGLLNLTLQPKDLLPLLAPAQRTPGRSIVVVDRRRQVVASTDATFAPLSTVDLPAFERARSGEAGSMLASLDGVERVVTYGPAHRGTWVLYVIDDPAVVLAGERRLLTHLGLASLVVSVIAMAAGAALLLLYRQLLRHRAELAELNARLGLASRHKSEFLANMSHELRTPLNAILGFAALLREQLLPTLTERQTRYIGNIQEAGQHLLELINDVLDLSTVEAGKIELRPETLTLAALLEPVLATARHAAAKRRIDLRVPVGLEGSVRVDPARVRQVLYNLLSNALKFTPAGGRVVLDVRLVGADLGITVADTGIGIPADRRDRVFGMFERLHEDRPEVAGTGLGLALTKRLVELHGGTIDFESEEGVGTTFRVWLPGVVAEVVSGPRLLIVEDDPRDADLIVEIARSVGLRSEVVASASAALAAVARDRPIGVVLDLRLPDERGERVLEALKREPETRTLPVLVVTIEDDTGRVRRLGAEDHLTKPTDTSRLREWLRGLTPKEEEVMHALTAR